MDHIIKIKDNLIETIRDYSRKQKENWQKIPLLALEADGRSGFCEKYQRAYISGFWALEGSISRYGGYSVYVDLSNGELVNAYSASSSFSVCDSDCPKESIIKLAGNNFVLQLASSIDELNTQKVISSLEKEARYPYPSYYNKDKQEAWREETREKYNIKEIFNR